MRQTDRLDEESVQRLKTLKRAKASILAQQRRVRIPHHLGGFKNTPSTNKQFDWQLRLDEIQDEIDILIS